MFKQCGGIRSAIKTYIEALCLVQIVFAAKSISFPY